MSTSETALALSLAIQNGELLARADGLLPDDFRYTGWHGAGQGRLRRPHELAE